MKPRRVSSSQSCSCSTCSYKSASERPSIRNVLAKGSRIDKFYLGKYIPLREKKLLEKLVRTRAVYDDLRTQLLSESNITISEKADLQTSNSAATRRDKELHDVERSDAILELVNLIDKGDMLRSRKLSECCSCCSCGSTISLQERGGRVHRHERARMSSRSSLLSGYRNKDERRKGRHLRFKAKHISSDPCTCTFKFSGLIKNESKALIKKLHGKKQGPSFVNPFETYEANQVSSGKKNKIKAKQSGMGEIMKKSLTKVRQSKARLSKVLKAGTKKSIEAIKNVHQNFKGNIEESIIRLIHSTKPDVQQEDEIVFNAVRDSITKYKEDLKNKSVLEDFECDFVCDPEECKPEECFKIKTRKRLRKGLHKTNVGLETENKAMKTTKVQNTATGNITKIDSATGIDNNRTEGVEPSVKQNKNKNAKVQEKPKCLCENMESKTPLKTKSVKSNTSLRTNNSKTSIQSAKGISLIAEPPHVKDVTPKKRTGKATPETYKSERKTGLALRRCFCTLKLKPQVKKVKQVGQAVSKLSQTTTMFQSPVLLPYECEPMVCIPGDCDPIVCEKRIRKRRKHYSTITTKRSQTTTMFQSPVLLPYECEPMVCIPGDCDPIVCEKRIRKRKKHHSTITTNDTNYKSKSTPSLISKSVSSGESNYKKTYKVPVLEKTRPSRQGRPSDNDTKPRQAVRISSNFSFNIEFYKDKGNSMYDNLNTRSPLKTANKSIKGKHFGHPVHKSSQISSSGKSKYTLTKHNLRKCFCTLKLVKPESKRNKIQTQSRGTLTSGQSLPATVKPKAEVMDRAVEKSEGNISKYTLLPYECEPGICVPGECDPYRCLELINQRKVKTRTRQSETDQRKTKSSYSITRRGPHKKSVIVQSANRKKNSKVVKTKPEPRETISSSVTPHKQAVRIGSTFSFNIEFYKDKSPLQQTLLKEFVRVKPKQVERNVAIKGKSSQGHTVKSHKKSSLAQVEKKEQEVASQSNIKRCFCTHKLHKRAKIKNEIQLLSVGTETALGNEEMYPIMKVATRGTKISKINQLKPYECEPNFCVPGLCDPNQCLKRILTRDQTRSKEFGTITNPTTRKSTSSATKTYKKGKNAMTHAYQKPKQIKKSNVTPSTNNSNESRVSTNIVHKTSSRQAVQIGSNFSFSVEFGKDRSAKNYISKQPRNLRPKTSKDSGDNYRRTPRKMGFSQTLENKRSSKSSGIRPMLKRCFCTLKLQKNPNLKKSHIVMPILMQNAFSAVYKNELCKLRDLLTRQPIKNETYLTSFSSTFSSSSYTESSHYTVHQDFYRCQRSKCNNFDFVVNSNSLTTKLRHRNTLIGLNQYLKSSFYAMNINVQNKQKGGHKLKPYECEPGVCIPGQCNPIECQKLIMRRLMKGASTMASTEKSSQSISTDALHATPKRQQYNETPAVSSKVKKEQGFKYKTLPKAHKQMVRIGSTFSFDIEFSKGNNNAQHAFKESKRKKVHGSCTNTNCKKSESRSTRSSQAQRQHRTSQSFVSMQDKGSNITPKIKRCFCTLKIQKKGRQNKSMDSKGKDQLKQKNDVHRTSDVGQNTKKVKLYSISDLDPHNRTSDVGQNTKKVKLYSLSDLDPHECEPNICIPGECDPYECLKRIKNRGLRKNTKHFGTDMRPYMNSVSSMTSSQKRAIGKQVHVKQEPKKAVKSKIDKNATKPRQAVRIGSSFSFNVEFYKDKSFPAEASIPTTSRECNPTKCKKIGKVKNTNQKSIQDSRYIRHHDSQVELPGHHEKSTKTGSLMKRCFCTANLLKQNNKNTSPSFLKKCFCVLKSLTATKPKLIEAQTNKSVEPKPQSFETNAYAQTKKLKEKLTEREKQLLKLDPNECEPGVCIPGECDPLICKEIIRKRYVTDKFSSTEDSHNRTISTITQAKKVKTSKSTDSNVLNTKNKIAKSKPQRKQRSQSEKRSISPSPDRNAVRIGSNFSFSVEFYKEKHIQRALSNIKRHREAATEFSKLQNKCKGSNKKDCLQNCDSQVDCVTKVNKSSDMGPILKRCFCTLALWNQEKQKKGAKLKTVTDVKEKGLKLESRTKSTETRNLKFKKPHVNHTKPYKLEPYECEPGVCVPGQCDPYECIKLIKRRQRKTSGTTTMKLNSKSASTMNNGSRRKHKNQNIQAKNQRKKLTGSKHRVPVNKISFSPKDGAKQAVRVGSIFSFDIEFSKSRNGGTNNFIDKTPKTRHKNRNTNCQSVSSRNQKSQEKRDSHDAYSQVFAKKVRSTLTEMAPLLKRCFCTLTLKNEGITKNNLNVITPIPEQAKNIKPSISQFDKNINTDKLKSPPRTLDPNECEPGICVPGECDPLQCLKRIQKRMLSKMSNTEAARGQKVSTSTSKPEFSSANTTTGVNKLREPSDIRARKKRPSQSPTNSNKQAVRIGSTFSFNIEFFKDKTDNLPKPEKAILKSKQCVQTCKAACSTQSQSQSKHVDRQLQSHGHDTMSKASGVGPIMKRCFCTLKLQKVGKLQQRVPEPVRKTKDSSASAKFQTKIEESKISKDTGTNIKKKYLALEPYECEPNTCIPGLCNPLECYERIKLRNLNEFGTDTIRPSTVSVSSLTDRKPQLKKNQTSLHKITNDHAMKGKPLIKPHVQRTAKKGNRQSVRIGSSFNFDVEFSKGISQGPTQNPKYDSLSMSDTHKKNKTRAIKTTNQGSFSQSTSQSTSDHHKAQQAFIRRESVGSGIAPLLKRCFCTLTVHNTKTNRLEHISTSYCKKLKVKPTNNVDFYKERVLTNKIKSKSKRESIAGKTLKKVFCPTKCKPYKSANIETVGRVDKMITMSPFKPSQYYVYQIKQQRYIGSDDFVEIEMKTANTKINNRHSDQEPNYQNSGGVKKKKNTSKEIKTILPFTPRKFIKNGSNTIFSHNGIAKGAKNYCCPYQGKNCMKKISITSNLPSRTISKHIRLTSKDEKITLPRLSPGAVLKNIFCLQLFSKRKNENIQHLNINPKRRLKNNNRQIKTNADVLKKSKSARCSKKCTLGEPKKSKSLKTTVISTRKDEHIDQQKKKYSRLQSGDSNSRQKTQFSNNNNILLCHCHRLFANKLTKADVTEKAANCTAVFNMKHEKTRNYPNWNLNEKDIFTNQKNQGILFECVRKLSNCKNHFVNTHIPLIIHSGDRKSYSVCKSKNAKYKDELNLKCMRKLNDLVLENAKEFHNIREDTFKTELSQGLIQQINRSKSKDNLQNIPKHQPKKKAKVRTETVSFLVENQQEKKNIKKSKQNYKINTTNHAILKQQKVKKFIELAINENTDTTGDFVEECPATNHLINTYQPKNKKKTLEPSYFGCHLYMASNKKPWPVVCSSSPRLSILNFCKQFTDMVLLLLGLVVWSPCKFIVKRCRAAVCCICMSRTVSK